MNIRKKKKRRIGWRRKEISMGENREKTEDEGEGEERKKKWVLMGFFHPFQIWRNKQNIYIHQI